MVTAPPGGAGCGRDPGRGRARRPSLPRRSSPGCGSDRRQVKLIYAGSLIVPFDRLAAAFEKEHPGWTW